MLLTGKSGIDPETGFVFDVGAEWKGTSPNKGGDFLLPVKDLRASFVNDPLFMYQRRQSASGSRAASRWAQIYEPYFDRTPRHFSGHVNAASKPDASGFAAGVREGQLHLPELPDLHLLPAGRRRRDARDRRAADPPRARGEPLVTTSLPRAGRVTVRAQAGKKRDVVHLLHATPALRGTTRGAPVQPIQDLVTLHDIAVSVAPRAR